MTRIWVIQPSPSRSSRWTPSFGSGSGQGRIDERIWLGDVEVDLGAVDADPGDDVQGRLVEQAGDAFVGAVPDEQLVDGVEGDGGAGHLAGVDVGVDEVGGLLVVRAGFVVGKDHAPDVAPFVGLADRVDRDEDGMCRSQLRSSSVSSAYR